MGEMKGKRLAPYVSVSVLKKFFEEIRHISTPRRVDGEVLRELGISQGNVGALLSALKFLGLLREDGTPTSQFRVLQTSGEEFRKGLEEVVREAYREVFAHLDVRRCSREQVHNFFAKNYSPAIAKKATILFLSLCREAGILPSEEVSEELEELQEERKVEEQRLERLGSLGLMELYARKLIESELNVTIAPGMDAEAIREARAILLERHKVIKEILQELERREKQDQELKAL